MTTDLIEFYRNFDSSRMMVARRLTAERFAPFGRLLMPALDTLSSAGSPSPMTELATTLSAPVLNTGDDRHKRDVRAFSTMRMRPHSETAYHNLGPGRALLAVAPSQDRDGFSGPDHGRCAAFIVAPGQAFVINQGIWSSDPSCLDGLLRLRSQWFDQPGTGYEGWSHFDPPRMVKLRRGRASNPYKRLIEKLTRRAEGRFPTASG